MEAFNTRGPPPASLLLPPWHQAIHEKLAVTNVAGLIEALRLAD